jgi:hypothetical protein
MQIALGFCSLHALPQAFSLPQSLATEPRATLANARFALGCPALPLRGERQRSHERYRNK